MVDFDHCSQCRKVLSELKCVAPQGFSSGGYICQSCYKKKCPCYSFTCDSCEKMWVVKRPHEEEGKELKIRTVQCPKCSHRFNQCPSGFGYFGIWMSDPEDPGYKGYYDERPCRYCKEEFITVLRSEKGIFRKSDNKGEGVDIHKTFQLEKHYCPKIQSIYRDYDHGKHKEKQQYNVNSKLADVKVLLTGMFFLTIALLIKLTCGHD